MMKLLIALAVAAPSALAFTHYVSSTDEPTAMPSTSPTKDPTAAPTAEKNGAITHTGTNFGGGPVDIIARPLRPSASEGPRRRRARAQVFSTPTEITVSTPGEAKIFVRDPRPLRPPARESEGTRTQALPKNGVTVPVTFECYGVEVTTGGTPSSFLCNGLPGP